MTEQEDLAKVTNDKELLANYVDEMGEEAPEEEE